MFKPCDMRGFGAAFQHLLFRCQRGEEQRTGGARTRRAHQCCLLDSFHCSPPDSRNAARARTLCARLAGAPRHPPGLPSARGRRGRGTAATPGPGAPSPARPAGTAPRDALEAECHRRKCRWSCCSIWKGNSGHIGSWDVPVFFAECGCPVETCWHRFTKMSSVLPLCGYLGIFWQTQQTFVSRLQTACKTKTALPQVERRCTAAESIFNSGSRDESSVPAASWMDVTRCVFWVFFFCSLLKSLNCRQVRAESLAAFLPDRCFPLSVRDWFVTSPPLFPAARVK